ncbi:MAG: TonB-dependent receptor [Bryobacteraceae bacterium]|nr:TonB-dependent receptor [Bryobacteraceae bacterium]
MKRFAWLACLALALAWTLAAQIGNQGAILGVVVDPSGAAVPGAEVAVRNLGTGLAVNAITDGSGNFEVLALPIGAYSVSVTQKGFKTWRLERLQITVGERSRVSPVLEVGEVSEQVTVEAIAELIQTEKASVEGVVVQKQIQELPLNGRNTIQLVSLVPGMRFLGKGGPERSSSVQGQGNRGDDTQFTMDGLNANAGMDEAAFAIPNVDTIAEFNVQGSTFSAEYGRNPLQVVMATKSGTNEFHGSAWEFLRNQKLDARNTFGLTKPKLIRNQFGAAVGGPIMRDRTFFFGSFEGTRIRQERIYNSTVVQPAMLEGNFSGLGRTIRDPQTGEPFPNNVIPADRIAPSAKFFFPHLLMPNSADGRFRTVAPVKNDTNELTTRIDHQITNSQRLFGRYIVTDNPVENPDYRPDVVAIDTTRQHSVGLNYVWSITPTTLFTINAGYQFSNNQFHSAVVGIDNLTQQAGINGFPTSGREGSTGLPTVGITGYTGFQAPWGHPGRLWMESWGGKSTVTLIRGKHSLSLGYEFDNRTTFGAHASFATRGNFGFNGQYTGDGFADYLLGLTASAGRNYPIQTFGMKRSPYSGIFVQDFFKVSPKLTLNLGLRYDRWHAKRAVRGNVATFDPRIGKAVAGEDKNGNVDLTAQPVARFLAEATKDIWVSASQAGMPPGLFQATGYLSPRVGFAYRPLGKEDFVVRGGYGIFTSAFRGNVTASAIVGPPYWSYETLSFSATSNQRWETAFPVDPTSFIAPSVLATAWDIKPQKAHEWNISVQTALPLRSALTLSYVGNHVFGAISANPLDEVPPGQYTNIQAARPFPAFSSATLYDNLGDSWYNAFQLKWERRFTNGLSFTAAYSLSRLLLENIGPDIWTNVTPFAPAGYNRGRSSNDRTHIMTLNGIYELPFGKGRRYLSGAPKAANIILGGWQVSAIYAFISGAPLSVNVPGATLGNGWGTRADLVGDPDVPDAGPARWFNPAAFAAPARYTFGNSALGLLDGPGVHSIDTALSKNFYVTEGRYLQFRWEMFNMPNHVNYNNPNTTFGIADTGRIFSAGSARNMQFGLKFIF